MEALLAALSFWGHIGTAFCYAALAIWVFHKYGSATRQQRILILSLGVTAAWGLSANLFSPTDFRTLSFESARNLCWLGFMFFLLRSGDGRKQPRTINMIYLVLLALLLLQPVVDGYMSVIGDYASASKVIFQAALLLRMIFAVGALVLVHNLYIVSAPEARWGISRRDTRPCDDIACPGVRYGIAAK
jgi:hypothetical protein